MENENQPHKPERLGSTLLRAEVFAQGCLLQALASSHPVKAKLREIFTHYTERYIASTLAGGADDVSIRAFEMHVGRLMAIIDAA